MPLTPQITLTATLQDVSGTPAGTTIAPAVLRIALCGFGLTLPCIAGTSNVAQVGPEDFYDEGDGVSVQLWGNDVIIPLGTYYAITLLDGDGNILQCGAYRFIGSQTIDLSNAPQIYPAPPTSPDGIPVLTNPPAQALQTIDGSITIEGNLIVTGTINDGGTIYTVAFSTTPVFDGDLGSSFKITLTGNVTSSTIVNMGGKITVPFRIIQDATGGRAWVWPANVRGGGDVNPGPNARSMQLFALDTDGSMDAVGPIMYS